ncbi:flagellin [Neoaquamicrobium sediminum]|jgi:flagellin|uniref:Flagellin n=1 Tax=Neoaquamicrobium sediminum TaxID=1849104 RepID=A0ABV3WZF2_9HYPH|nr:flagellin [Mesorhizobium sp.]
MTSLLTNASAMTALQTLTKTNNNLATTQNRIATGERVSQASDNAAYWSISVGMKNQSNLQSVVKDSIGFGKAILDAAYTGLDEAIKLTSEIHSRYLAREQDGVDTAAIDAEIAELKTAIEEIAQAADFEGQNLLATGGANVTVVTGYIKGDGTAGSTETKTLTLNAYDLEAETANMTDADTTEASLVAMREAASELGAMKTRLDAQLSFTSKLMDALDRGVGQLVDADMNAESARLSALQVQQQLGIQALSIANSNSQNILSLFR